MADAVIGRLCEILSPGDVIIDGGNTHFRDTERRTKYVESKGLLYIGTGVSGGEEGARKGPSIMPGGSPAAWPHVKDIFQAVSAKVEGDTPCCDWVGEQGAGHYVKMIHNGIEYGDMQLITEAYHLMRQGLGLDVDDIQQLFARWNAGPLDSYLIEITADILARRDSNGAALIDSILDAAGQKGTGKWTGISALDLGTPLTLITEAVFSRCLSALVEQRARAAAVYAAPRPEFDGDRQAALQDLHDALYAAKVISYTQGYMLMRASEDLPNYEKLAEYQPPVMTRIHANDGRLISEFARQRRIYVPITAIPKRVIEAFLSAEDKNFYQHGGLDIQGIVRALVANLSAMQSGSGGKQGSQEDAKHRVAPLSARGNLAAVGRRQVDHYPSLCQPDRHCHRHLPKQEPHLGRQE